MRKIPIYTVDAFSRKPFSGNPAAVCLVKDEDLTDAQKQNLAMEMNLSETAYVRVLNPGDSFEKSSSFELRWFTPTNEVKLCGHATLASAAVLFHAKGNESKALTFHTKSGELTAEKHGDQISIKLPVYPCSDKVPEGTDELVKACLGALEPKDVQYTHGDREDLIIILPDSISRQEFEQLTLDTSAMFKAHNTGEVMGVIITVRGSKDNGAVDEDGKEFDFLSRYFAPWNGITEDPVTGSAHTVLAPYWSKILGKKEMYTRQCSKRGGNLQVRLGDDGWVEIAGETSIVLEGTVNVE